MVDGLSVVTTTRQWLGGLQDSGTPLLLGTVILPLSVADSAVTKAATVLQRYVIPIAVVGILLPAIHFVIFVWLGQAFLDAVLAVFSFADNVVGYFHALWVGFVFRTFISKVLSTALNSIRSCCF